MLYRQFGKTGKKVSLVGFGGMRFNELDDRKQCVEPLIEAAQEGVNYFDTAPAYFGVKSEEVFGEGFSEMRRQGLPFYCATKTTKSKEDEIQRELEGQLKRLRVDSIDFYHIWCLTSLDGWRERKRNGVLEAFAKLKQEGLIQHICVSSHLIGDEIKDLLMEGVFEGVLFGYSAYNFAFRQAAFEAIAKRKLGCVVMNPLGGGLIPRHPEIFGFIKTRRDQAVVEAALHFLFAHEDIHTTLVGFAGPEEVREVLRAVQSYRGDISAKHLKRIKNNAKQSFENLCTGCQYCENCPEGIPVSKFMGAYNYKTLYGDDKPMLDQLKWHWNLPAEEAEKCTGCGECEEACTQHLAIIERLKEIGEIARWQQKQVVGQALTPGGATSRR